MAATLEMFVQSVGLRCAGCRMFPMNHRIKSLQAIVARVIRRKRAPSRHLGRPVHWNVQYRLKKKLLIAPQAYAIVLTNNSLAMPCPGQSQSRQFSTSRSIVVFTQPTSPKRTNCQLVLPRVLRLEATCTCVMLVSPGKSVGVSDSSNGITRKGSLSLISSKHVRLFIILAGSCVPI